MENFKFALEGAWQVLFAGLLLGAGLPAIFAIGMRLLAVGSGEIQGSPGRGTTSSSVAKVAAAACFLIVVLGVALGLTIIIASGFGKEVSFEHLYPILKDKE